MAKKFVKISLATKFRLLFGAAVVLIIAAALILPWYFTERLNEQIVQRLADEITRMRLNEWLQKHPKNPKFESEVAAIYAGSGQMDGREGPMLIRINADMTPERSLDSAGRGALKNFKRSSEQETQIVPSEDARGRTLYRCFRAVRIEQNCTNCHGPSMPPQSQFQRGQLVGVIDVSIPGSAASPAMVWWTRGAFLVGGALAAVLAFFTFTLITQRLVLRPVRHLRDMADKVAEGDLSVRSTIRTGDELQRLGDSFNDMLAAISDQHNKLRSANRALDLKLSELGESNVALFQANKVKTEFLTNVSHELRTPLNSIMGFADLVGESTDERIHRYGQNIGSAAKNLLNMINDLLDLAKIEAGKADVRFDKVSVTDACQTLVALIKPLADKKQLDLRAELAADLPLVVTDAGKLQQVLYNLLSNAVKFTPPNGQVMVCTGRSPFQRGSTMVEGAFISVADTGPGVAEADQQRIFEKFYQVDRTLTKESSGTGLGLAISKELATLLGGRLTLKSSPGNGAVFTLFIPLDATEERR